MTTPWAVLNEYDPDLHGSTDTIPPAAQRYMAVWLTVAAVVLPILAWWLLK